MTKSGIWTDDYIYRLEIIFICKFNLIISNMVVIIKRKININRKERSVRGSQWIISS